MSDKTINFRYLREEGGKFIFLMDRNWASPYGIFQHVGDSAEVFEHELFLEEQAGGHWYYGGDRYLEGDERNHGIVITNLASATLFRMAYTGG